MTAIAPTPGRVIWYTPAADDGINRISGQPLAALIAGINEDGTLNLFVLDAKAVPTQRHNVVLVQEDDLNVPAAGFASWMPYQLGQAAKTEAAEAAAAAATDGHEEGQEQATETQEGESK